MPLEIRRFGVGHRRSGGPAGATGVEEQVVHGGPDGTIVELAFGRRSALRPHAAPVGGWLLVIEGGGWVRVGDDAARVSAGDAVAWPAGILRAAWTEGSPMRAFVVELPAGGGAVPSVPLVLEAGADRAPGRASRGEGRLAPHARVHGAPHATDGEGEPR